MENFDLWKSLFKLIPFSGKKKYAKIPDLKFDIILHEQKCRGNHKIIIRINTLGNNPGTNHCYPWNYSFSYLI